jgi:hypothetical protein
MKIIYSELIEKFQDILGTPKELIEETLNKPNNTDIVMNRYISVKNFGDFYILIIFDMEDKSVKLLNAYRIYSKLLDGNDISKMKPFEVLTEFMNRYGVSRNIPGLGEHKIFIEKQSKIFFQGILDIDKYLEALKSI